jgi:hypothetical protein
MRYSSLTRKTPTASSSCFDKKLRCRSTNPLSPPSAPVQRRLQGPTAKSKFLAGAPTTSRIAKPKKNHLSLLKLEGDPAPDTALMMDRKTSLECLNAIGATPCFPSITAILLKSDPAYFVSSVSSVSRFSCSTDLSISSWKIF